MEKEEEEETSNLLFCNNIKEFITVVREGVYICEHFCINHGAEDCALTQEAYTPEKRAKIKFGSEEHKVTKFVFKAIFPEGKVRLSVGTNLLVYIRDTKTNILAVLSTVENLGFKWNFVNHWTLFEEDNKRQLLWLSDLPKQTPSIKFFAPLSIFPKIKALALAIKQRDSL